MKRVRSLVAGVLALIMFGVGEPAFAQSQPGQWVGDRYLVKVFLGRSYDTQHTFLMDENDGVHLKIPNLKYSADFPIPRDEYATPFSIIWHDGAAYSLASGPGNELDEDGRRMRRHFYAKWEDGEWSLLGEFKTPFEEPIFTAIPCDKNCLIVVSNDRDLTGNVGPDRTPFARFSIAEGTTDMRLDSSIDHGQEALRGRMADPVFFNQVGMSHLIMTDGHATLLNPNTGLYWVFSLEKASLIHAGNIFKKVTPEMIARGGFSMAVLCANPEKAGTLLISAQEEDLLVMEDGNWWDEFNELQRSGRFDGLSDEDLRKIWDRSYQDALDKSPFMAWYRLDPESGKVEKLREPPEGGTWMREDAEGRTLHDWRPMPDGSVKMGWNFFDLSTRLANKAEKTESETDSAAAAHEGELGEATQDGEAVSDGGTNFDGDRDSAENTKNEDKQTEVAEQ